MEKPLAPIQPAEPTPPPAWQGRKADEIPRLTVDTQLNFRGLIKS